MPSKTLYPSVNLPSIKPVAIHYRAQAVKAVFPLPNTASVFIYAGAVLSVRNFSRPLVKPKITNWRIPNIVDGFNFVDGTDFDFVDGTPFDFMDA